MKTSEETKEIFAAIVKASGEMPPVPKTATNPHFRSKYAPLDAIVKTATPVLNKHGLAVVQGGEPDDNGKVRISTRVIHTSGQWIESSLDMTPQKNDPQGVGSCVTYGSRYGYRMVGVVTDEDDDGNGGSNPPPKKPISSPQSKSAGYEFWSQQIAGAKVERDLTNMAPAIKRDSTLSDAERTRLRDEWSIRLTELAPREPGEEG